MWLPLYFVLLAVTLRKCSADEIWEQDLSNDMEIGASTEGYDKVSLRCAAERMLVDLNTTNDFSGVIYTQGSFYSRQSACFLDPIRGKSFSMDIPFNECETKKEGEKYSNILVLQHDDDLVTPGDAAFILECDFSRPRDLKVTADIAAAEKREVRSSISLIDADPGRDSTKRAAHVESKSGEVVFAPNVVSKISDEL